MPGKELAKRKSAAVVQREVQQRIRQVRRKSVILDSDLAAFYGVATGALVRQMKRNQERFPEDFAFQLTPKEAEDLKRQIGDSSWGGRRRDLPWVFTEVGAIAAAGVLRSGKAAEVSVDVHRAFVSMREKLLSLDDFSRAIPEIQERLEALEGDAAQLQESDADLNAKVEKLADGLKDVTAVIRTMKKVDKALPPHS